MREISTHIGVYAILPIAAFYGSTSAINQQGKTASNAAIIIRKAATPTKKKGQTATSDLQQSKIDNLKTGNQ